jgi:hypothetical protein
MGDGGAIIAEIRRGAERLDACASVGGLAS